ncbi:MAG: MlaD family protein [Solirubrobacterales bacterium]
MSAPVRFARVAWRFIDPKLKVGRVPFTRTVLVMQLIAALIFLGYTLAKKGTRGPFSEEPYTVQVLMADAQGLNPAKEPAAGVAGVNVGKVIEAEVEESGQALVTLELDPEMKGKVFADATAFVRPTSALQTLIVNVDPGTPDAGTLPEGEPIGAAQTENFVHIDELTGLLDADTQAQAQILIREAATALRGREPELRAILGELGTLTETATPIAEALAERRRLVTKLTDNMDVLFTTLGRRGTQLAHAIEVGNDTLAVTGGRDAELAEATRELAPTLSETTRALSASRELATPLSSALDSLNPAAPELEPAAVGLRELLPAIDGLVTNSAELVKDGRKPVSLFSEGLKGLSERVRNDQIPALRELVDLVDLLFEYRNGLIQFAEGFSGATSTNRRAGPYAQIATVDAEATPEGFGLSPRAARSKDGGPSQLEAKLAEALEQTCRESNPIACLYRFSIPGLPQDPVMPAKSGGGER